MKKFKIPVSWEMCGCLEIEAETLQEAVNLAIEKMDEFPLPEGNYIDSSFKVDAEDAEIYN